MSEVLLGTINSKALGNAPLCKALSQMQKDADASAKKTPWRTLVGSIFYLPEHEAFAWSDGRVFISVKAGWTREKLGLTTEGSGFRTRLLKSADGTSITVMKDDSEEAQRDAETLSSFCTKYWERFYRNTDLCREADIQPSDWLKSDKAGSLVSFISACTGRLFNGRLGTLIEATGLQFMKISFTDGKDDDGKEQPVALFGDDCFALLMPLTSQRRNGTQIEDNYRELHERDGKKLTPSLLRKRQEEESNVPWEKKERKEPSSVWIEYGLEKLKREKEYEGIGVRFESKTNPKRAD